MVNHINNHIAEYKEKEVVCQQCKGEGVIKCSRAELLQGFREPYHGLNYPGTYRLAMRRYRYWQKTGKGICAECEGEGKWTEGW